MVWRKVMEHNIVYSRGRTVYDPRGGANMNVLGVDVGGTGTKGAVIEYLDWVCCQAKTSVIDTKTSDAAAAR